MRREREDGQWRLADEWTGRGRGAMGDEDRDVEIQTVGGERMAYSDVRDNRG